MIITRSRKSNRRRLIFDGNSLMVNSEGPLAGGQRLALRAYNAVISAGVNLVYHNCGLGGQRIINRINNFDSNFNGNSSEGDILVFWEISNAAHDYTTDTDGTQLYADMMTYFAKAKTYGLKTVCITGIARDYPSYDDPDITDRIFACNALLRATPTNIDVIADAALLTPFDEKTDTTNATYYHTDQTHLKNAGYDYISDNCLQAAIESLL